jgi:hypothetical protein
MNAALVLLLAAAQPNDGLHELRQIMQCGTGEAPRQICCRIALEQVRDAHLSGDFETERILGNYLKRNCPKPILQ